jgi:hypothetical protein
MALHANYSQLIVALLDQAWKIHGRFNRDNHAAVVHFVRTHVNEARERHNSYSEAQQLEARVETDQHFTPSGNVRKFAPVEPLADEDGWK